MTSLEADLIARIVVITAVFSIISYLVVQRNIVVTPALFVLFGMVVLISVLYDLRRFGATNKRA